MILNINTTGEKVELSNYLLAQAIDSVRSHPAIKKQLQLSDKDIDKIESFRNQLLKSYFSKFKSSKS